MLIPPPFIPGKVTGAQRPTKCSVSPVLVVALVLGLCAAVTALIALVLG